MRVRKKELTPKKLAFIALCIFLAIYTAPGILYGQAWYDKYARGKFIGLGLVIIILPPALLSYIYIKTYLKSRDSKLALDEVKKFIAAVKLNMKKHKRTPSNKRNFKKDK